MTYGRLARAWGAVCLLLAAACSGDGVAVVTAVKLTVNFGSATGLDQIRVYANLAEGGGNILPPVVRPEEPTPLEGSNTSVVIVFPDEYASRAMFLRVDGIAGGDIVGSGIVPVTLGRRRLIETTVQLGTAVTCGDAITSDGIEQCDDGNANQGDGCDQYCFAEAGFTCFTIGSRSTCVSSNTPACANTVDDDGDGLADLQDPGCATGSDGSERADANGPPCDDGEDDDGDGTLDYRLDSRGDPGCTDVFDFSERGTNACDDGVDNDGDGLVDAGPDASNDPGCTSPGDTSERGTLACDNGLDDDNDGRGDFSVDGNGDTGCTSPTDASERGATACDNGLDDDIDGRTDFSLDPAASDPGCDSSLDTNERGSRPCDDDNDNDNDGLKDYHTGGLGDPGCDSPLDLAERGSSQCDDGIDADNDGRADFNLNALATDPG